MNYALFLVKKPRDDVKDAEQLLQNFLRKLPELLKQNDNGIFLSPNLVEVRINGNIQFLLELVNSSKGFQCQSQVMFFETKPLWIIS